MGTLTELWNQIFEAVTAAFGHAVYGTPLAWATVLVLAWLANFVTRRVILRALRLFIDRSKVAWDDVLVKHKVFHRLAHLAPAMVFFAAAPLLFPAEDEQGYELVLQRLATVWMYLAGARAVASLLDAVVALGMQEESTRDKPIRSYAQVVKLVMWMAVGIVVVATLIDRSPWGLLTGLGAMTAILLLVFKDTILGFVASIQIAGYDMVRTGDWIEMPKFGADGDVVDISLNTVKVQNWDKTITTIPTYMLVTESFKNWRGMQESGGRRIKRAVAVDMNSIRFLADEDLERMREVRTIREYLDRKQKEVADWNREQGYESGGAVDARRLTNIGTFRAYLEHWLKRNPNIKQDMTFLVRQLAPGPQGLPIEIYVFSADQRWAYYEGIMADIFDHVLAVLPAFGLRVYQEPSGADLRVLQLGGAEGS